MNTINLTALTKYLLFIPVRMWFIMLINQELLDLTFYVYKIRA